MTLQPSSSPTVGDAQHAVSVTDNQHQAETNQQCTPTCSSNGTHSDGYTGAFEGPEKLLEMWFAPSAEAATCINQDVKLCDEDMDQWSESRSGLRCVPRAVWRDMLDLVHCQVLSTLCNEHLDSYLLRQVSVSESSFFVYAHKLVLKTCGTTTLLYAIPRIIEIARAYLGIAGVHQLFYSRKNFMFPDQQEELHRSWEKEVMYLDAHFPEGSAYLIGKTNRDHWHVYMSGPHEPESIITSSGDRLAGVLAQEQGEDDEGSENLADTAVNNSAEGSPLFRAVSRSSSRSTVRSMLAPGNADCAQHGTRAPGNCQDTTVEILMTGLDPERMRLMYLGGASTIEGAVGGKAVERESGIAEIYPESASDSYLFTPCGFSLNGIQNDGYYTIHVTPEPHCSYASFETNVARDSSIDLDSPLGIKKLVEQVTNVFGPRFVTVTVFKARSGSSLSDEQTGVFASALTFSSDTKLDGAKGHQYAAAAAADVAPPTFAPVDGYKSVDRVLYEFDHYWLRYGYYVKAN